ncbi:MAG: hypothetical protein LH469_14315 [Frankiaceae bacterium]|nr:hypothetical protein [Frankiaceae bacterium]
MSLLPAAVLLLAALLAALLRGSARGRGVTVLAAAAALAVALPLALSGTLPPVRAAAQLFTLGLVVVVAVFSRRHLDGDPGQARYDRLLLATAGAAVLAVSTGDLLVLAVAWIATGSGITALVGHHAGLPATARAVTSLRRARLAGDTALVLAVGTLVVAAGSSSLEDVTAEAAASPWGPRARGAPAAPGA